MTFDGPKEKHDRIRVTVSGKPTFDIICNNIKNYLEASDENLVRLRIHVDRDTNEEDILKIAEFLNGFDEKYCKRISLYTHVVFPACTGTWASECYSECKINDDEKIEESKIVYITSKIREEISKLGYSMEPYSQNVAYLSTCEFDIMERWLVRPDGYLTKCSVAIERERAVGRLTENGIEIFPERFSKIIRKEYSSKFYEYCYDCEYLPFCWRGCIYKNYLDDFDNFIKINCFKNKPGDWIISRDIDSIKYRYLKERRIRNENK